MKIAIHAPRVSYYCGGAERYILNMAVTLQNINSNIYLITYDSPEKTKWFNEFKREFKGKIILLKSKEFDENFWRFKRATKPSIWDLESRLFSKITKDYYENNRFDIISLHYAFDCFGISKENKICLHLHGVPLKIRKVDKKAIKIPSKIIAVSKYVLDGWKKVIPFGKDIFVIYNGITKLKFKSLKKSNDILFFGRLIKTKGIDILIKSIRRNKELFNNISIKIVGEGPEKENLKHLSKKLNLNNNIKFLGFIPDSKLHKLIEISKISVFPSYKKEGVMTTILEAAMLKSVILASKSCSNEEFISNNSNGIFFKSRDAKDLSKKIKILLLDLNLQEKLVKNAYEKVRKWTWNNQAKKILKAYNR